MNLFWPAPDEAKRLDSAAAWLPSSAVFFGAPSRFGIWRESREEVETMASATHKQTMGNEYTKRARLEKAKLKIERQKQPTAGQYLLQTFTQRNRATSNRAHTRPHLKVLLAVKLGRQQRGVEVRESRIGERARRSLLLGDARRVQLDQRLLLGGAGTRSTGTGSAGTGA